MSAMTYSLLYGLICHFHFQFHMDQAQFEMGENETDIDIVPEAKEYLLYKVGEGIQTYYLPVILAAGLIGNTLSFIVMIQPQNRVKSFCIYACALAVSDSLMLVNSALYYYKTDISSLSNWRGAECPLFVYFFHVFPVYGVWVIVCMTLDRYVAIRHPLRNILWCSPRTARTAVIVLAPIVCFIKVPHYVCYRVIQKDCCAGFGKVDIYSYCRVASWVFLFSDSIVPFTILLIFNLLIIISVRRSRPSSARACIRREDQTGGGSAQ